MTDNKSTTPPPEEKVLTGAKILVVDDHPPAAQVNFDHSRKDPKTGGDLRVVTYHHDGADSLAELLERHGAQADKAYTYPDMMQKARATRPHIIIADHALNKADRMELQKLGIPVIHHTGNDKDVRAVLDALEDGTHVSPEVVESAANTVLKSDSRDKLIAVVRKKLNEGPARLR